MTKNLLSLILLLAACPAIAIDCDTTSNTIEMNVCGQIELDKLDKELNQIYKQVLAKFDVVSKEPSNIADKSEDKQNLIDAQRLGMKFRDADCHTTYTLWLGGTIRGQMYLGRMMSHTEQRIKQLKVYDTFAYGG